MAMMARRPVASSEQNTTCSCPECRANTPPTAPAASSLSSLSGPVTVVTQTASKVYGYADPSPLTTADLSGFLAADNVLRYPQRSSLTAVALGGALALLVTSASVIDGFRLSTDRWMRRSLPFDLSIQPAQLSSTIYSRTSLPGDLAERCAKIPGVAEVYGVRATILLARRDVRAARRACPFIDREG